MSRLHPRDPLHGITLERILEELVARHGWAEMGHRIPIRCFQFNPSVKSSLTFLRKTPWARTRVESWFLEEGLKSEVKRTPPTSLTKLRGQPHLPDPIAGGMVLPGEEANYGQNK